mgnify:CR=1 FL=1
MKLKNTFIRGKMNKDTDERFLPKGQYPHAENIRVANSDGSDVGALENVRGNEQLTNLNLTNGQTIGTFSDDSNQKIYWFVTSVDKDLVIEHDAPNQQTNILLESSRPNGILNFDRNCLITGVVKVINGDSNRDLLVWTDDLNPPRIINIERAKTYAVDGFIEDDISLIKKPPRYAPRVGLTSTPTTLENNIENKFLTFAYRYQYLDGGYSALSSFTNYTFAPSEFELDFQTMENEGMQNSFNAVNIEFNTGDERVTDVELVFKESNSNTIYVIETFNKANESWGNEETQSFLFSNNKNKGSLAIDELFRDFDNVPRKAKALELMGTRLAFGNYVEQYDLVNVFGEAINIDYSLSLITKNLTGEVLPLLIVDTANVRDSVRLDFTGFTLSRNNRITLDLFLNNVSNSGSYENSFDFILNRDYDDVDDLATDENFIYFIEEVITSHFENNYDITPPTDSIVESISAFTIVASTSTSITITAPIVTFRVANTNLEFAVFEYDTDTNVFYKEIAIDTSLKSNRSYEVGLKYLDPQSRATTVLTDEDNTIYIDQDLSVNQNRIIVNINHRPPVWADRYKFVVKQNKGNYQTIYTNIFYEDGLFRWIKLEGANINKVKEGDILIVKSDLGGVVPDIVRTRVLEIATKERNFIEGNEDSEGNEIIEEAGVYMKIKPVGFDMNFDDSTIRSYSGDSHLRYPNRTYTNPVFGTYDSGGIFQPYVLNAGSRVRIFINFKARGSISYDVTYDQRFRVNGNYTSIQDWFEAEVEDLGSFGEDYTRAMGGTTEGEYDYGFGFSKTGQDGFTQDGEKFYVWAHRDGTASRNITTTVRLEVISTDGILIFETEPQDNLGDFFYETEQTFDIVDDFHQGNIQNQDDSNSTAIVELDFFNCYVQGNGAESYRYKDALNVGTDENGQQLLANYLNIDLRPSLTSLEKYREVRRFSDITYSEPYSENSNFNGLNVFNLSKAPFKEDIDKKYGFIQRLYSRDTNLVVFQEDKVSYVLFGKDLLLNADGSSNVSSIEGVLGQQVAYEGEYGISRNPESFAYDAYNLYFADSKRGCICRLGRNGITEISMNGLRTWFKDEFKNAIDNKKLGAFDPYLDQYVLHSSSNILGQSMNIDCSGSFTKNFFSGTQVLYIDYDIFIGEAGFDYSSNGLPVKYDIEWNGQILSTGYVGDPIYNDQLNDLGLPNVSGSGDGTFTLDKTNSLPREIKVTVTAPLCPTQFTINGNCVERDELTVKNIILNDVDDQGLTIRSRYKWSTDTYSSAFTTYNSLFGEGQVELFNEVIDNEGTINIPLKGSTVRVESYKGFLQTAEWFEDENRLGYLISNVDYNEADLEDILIAATFPTITESIGGDGSVTRFIELDYNPLDPQQYLYLIWDYRNEAVVINEDTKIRIYFDSSGSMHSTLSPLQTMRDTILKDRLLPFYNNDEALYDQNVTIIEQPDERTFDKLNMNGDTPDGNVIVMVFQDEAAPIYHSGAGISPRSSAYNSDILTLRNRLASFAPNYYRGVIFQVTGSAIFPQFVQAVQNGSDDYIGGNGLSDRLEFNYKYELLDGGTPQYYLDQIVVALEELGYEL